MSTVLYFLSGLAQSDSMDKIFGTGVTGAPLSSGDVNSNFAELFGFGFNAVLVVAAIFTLVYLLWGAFDYIVAGGDSGKLDKARQKMINAVIGIILLIVVVSVWLVLTTSVLGIFEKDGGGFQFKLPTIRDIGGSGTPGGGTCPSDACFTGTSCPAGRVQMPDTCPSSGQICCFFQGTLPGSPTPLPVLSPPQPTPQTPS